MDDKFKPISKDTFSSDSLNQLGSNIPDIQKIFSSIDAQLAPIEPIISREHIKKTEQYQAESLKMLNSINQNTANLYTLVELVNKSSENQDELLGLLSEILEISKAQNKEEATSLYRKTMDRINTTIKDGDTLYKIVNYATLVYTAITSILSNG